MKTGYGWYGGGNGTNSSGFSGLPGGTRDEPYPADYDTAGSVGLWWSSSPYGSVAWCRVLGEASEIVYRSATNRGAGFSVRCVRDAE